MRNYRFYVIRKDGHIQGPAMEHDAPDDSAARDRAKQMQDGYDIEIWQAARLVGYIVSEEK